MHELGVVIKVVEVVESYVKQYELKIVDTLVLQVGELSSIIPKYIEACFPAAVDGTILEHTKLKIEVLPGNGLCQRCKKVSNLIKNNGKCLHCGHDSFDLLSGKEFNIKEIVAY